MHKPAPKLTVLSMTDLRQVIAEAERALAQFDRVWANTSNNPLPTRGPTASLRVLIPALSSLLDKIEDTGALSASIRDATDSGANCTEDYAESVQEYLLGEGRSND